MPTDALRAFRDTMAETREYGFDKLCAAQWELGNSVRAHAEGQGRDLGRRRGFGAPAWW